MHFIPSTELTLAESKTRVIRLLLQKSISNFNKLKTITGD